MEEDINSSNFFSFFIFRKFQGDFVLFRVVLVISSFTLADEVLEG